MGAVSGPDIVVIFNYKSEDPRSYKDGRNSTQEKERTMGNKWAPPCSKT